MNDLSATMVERLCEPTKWKVFYFFFCMHYLLQLMVLDTICLEGVMIRDQGFKIGFMSNNQTTTSVFK